METFIFAVFCFQTFVAIVCSLNLAFIPKAGATVLVSLLISAFFAVWGGFLLWGA